MKKYILIISLTVLIATLAIGGSQLRSQAAVDPCMDVAQKEINLMRKGWNDNLQSLLDQEKPSSEMVDEAFEGMRTYRCWLDYLCETVLFSGGADAATMEGRPITREHVDPLPGCVYPNDVKIPTTQLKFIPECNVPPTSDIRLAQANANFLNCRALVEQEFVDPPEGQSGDSSAAGNDFKNSSSAFIGLERALKGNSAKQQSRVLRDKFNTLLNKMYTMEAHMTQLREYIERLDSGLVCYIPQCD